MSCFACVRKEDVDSRFLSCLFDLHAVYTSLLAEITHLAAGCLQLTLHYTSVAK